MLKERREKEKKVEKAAGIDPAAPDEAAEWSERLTSRQGGLARRCRRRIDPRCFLHFLLVLHFRLFLSSFFQPPHSSIL